MKPPVVDAALLSACGLPDEPSEEVLKWFRMAVVLLQSNSNKPRLDAVGAVALAEAVVLFRELEHPDWGHPRPKYLKWVLDSDLQKWLVQIGAISNLVRLDSKAAEFAVIVAKKEYWLDSRGDDGWIRDSQVSPLPAGLLRASKLAEELATESKRVDEVSDDCGWPDSQENVSDEIVPDEGDELESGETTASPSTGDLKPSWDDTIGTLTFGDEEIRTIKNRGPTSNIVLIVKAFEEEEWPNRIDDPLPRGKLRESIRSLNTGITDSTIRFVADGTGEGIRWEIAD